LFIAEPEQNTFRKKYGWVKKWRGEANKSEKKMISSNKAKINHFRVGWGIF